MSIGVCAKPVPFQSTPPVKAATNSTMQLYKRWFISIHAAREGGDAVAVKIHSRSRISIHAAREGGDVTRLINVDTGIEFQSTPPVKAATGTGGTYESKLDNFNPRRP